MVAQPNNVIAKKIGLATLNTFNLRCLYMYTMSIAVQEAHVTLKTKRVILRNINKLIRKNITLLKDTPKRPIIRS